MKHPVQRPPIANWRILRLADGHVEFVAKETKNARLVQTRCALDGFIRLLASHVPDRYCHGIRYFGLLAPRAKNQHIPAYSRFCHRRGGRLAA